MSNGVQVGRPRWLPRESHARRADEIRIAECGDAGDVLIGRPAGDLEPPYRVEAHRPIGPVDDVP